MYIRFTCVTQKACYLRTSRPRSAPRGNSTRWVVRYTYRRRYPPLAAGSAEDCWRTIRGALIDVEGLIRRPIGLNWDDRTIDWTELGPRSTGSLLSTGPKLGPRRQQNRTGYRRMMQRERPVEAAADYHIKFDWIDMCMCICEAQSWDVPLTF